MVFYDDSMSPSASPLSAQTVTDWLVAMDFISAGVGDTVWTRHFVSTSHTIIVDQAGAGSISYGEGIVIGRNTVTNLLDLENLVVLECVVSLLVAGYLPKSIELERPFRVGRNTGGWLDLLVKRGDRTYLMIECKTAGSEYENELKKLTSTSNSQLLSYLVQDRDLEQAVLYSSEVIYVNGKPQISRKYAGFPTTFLVGGNSRDIFSGWNKELYTTGLFQSAPYSIHEKSLTVGDLEDLTQADGQQLFNLFREILRRHAVSDNANAFNKIFNLFICKILDEDKSGSTTPTEFQWGGSESDSTVLARLGGLYERGMREYLKLNLQQSDARLAAILNGMTPDQKREVSSLVAEVRQYNNTDFAFIDVYDKDTFDLNAKIVRDMVRLLQVKRLRYTQKHGFMGMFFEQLLNTSMKQESGQYFTPAPIAQFVNESLPIESTIAEKVAKQQRDYLPYAIDYAAGSGHFLTEYMDRVDKVLKSLSEESFRTNSQRQNHSRWNTGGLTWAGEFVYGIELDYRLAKTAKVSTFLNGDGDANVVRGNGLASFLRDSDFKKAGPKLVKEAAQKDQRDIATFDVVVANPPYSVAEFARSVEHGEESFELWEYLGDKSDKIEALFIERTKQLLADGGVAGLVLPTSLLTNEGVETQARAMLLRHFEVVAIVSLGGDVFIATDTPCSIVFLRRIPNSVSESIQASIRAFLETGTDSTILGIVDSISEYASSIHASTADELRRAIGRPLDSQLEIIRDYEWAMRNRSGRSPETRILADDGTEQPTANLLDFVRSSEVTRMEMYFLTRGKETLLVRAPEARVDKRLFLGYEFSERKRHEGISFLSGTPLIETPLFNPIDPDDTSKISTLIKASFDGRVSVPKELQPWAEVSPTAAIAGVTDMTMTWSLSTVVQPPLPSYAVPTERLGDLCDLAIGGTPSRQHPEYFGGDKLWLSVGEMTGEIVVDTKEKITAAGAAASNVKLVPAGTLLLSFKLSIGKIARAGVDLYTNEAIVALTPKQTPVADSPWIDSEYLESLLLFFGSQILRADSQAQKKIGRSLNLAYLRRLDIPVLATDARAEFVRVANDTNLSDTDKLGLLSSMLLA